MTRPSSSAARRTHFGVTLHAAQCLEEHILDIHPALRMGLNCLLSLRTLSIFTARLHFQKKEKKIT